MIQNCFIFQWAAYMVHRLSVTIDPKIEMKRYYRNTFGKNPNIEHPSNLLEKIYWMLLHTDTSLWTKCADKYSVRDFISKQGYADYMPKLYAKWDSPEEISFDNLPDSFVIKANNGCGSVYIVKNKKEESLKAIRKMAKEWLAIPFGYAGGQLHYISIKPCIIAEELLDNEFAGSISPHSMVDYKVWCINGDVECVLITYDRNEENYKVDLYDTQWNRCPDKLSEKRRDLLSSTLVPKPACLPDMLKIANKLSSTFPEVRVDFYVVNGKPVIGEMTFTAGMGSLSTEYYKYLGSKIDLSKVKRI